MHISLEILAHYLSLFIAFTYAYLGIPIIRFTITNSFLFNINKNITKKIEEISSEFKRRRELKILFDNSPDQKHVKNLADHIEPLIKEITRIEAPVKNLVDAKYLQPMFYLTGCAYLYFLVLGIFSDGECDSFFNFNAGIISILCIVYFITFFIILFLESFGKLKKIDSKIRRTFFVIILLIIAIISAQIFYFIFREKFQAICESHHWIEVVIYFLIILLPVFPYLFLVFREQFFINRFIKRFDQYEKQILEELKTLELLGKKK